MSKLILSLDGGGIRGAASAEFLHQIESRLHKSIYENFDMFAGTSTGAIIAASLGVLRFTATQITELYNYRNSNRMMNKSVWDKALGLMQNEPKYDGKGKREVLEEYFKETLLSDAEKPTLVVAYDVEKRRSAVLKSSSGDKIKSVDAVDASTAAPMYFPTVNVNDNWLIDGGVIANNPAMCAYVEAKWLWPSENIKVLSVGTGKRTRKIDGPESRDYGFAEWVRHDFLGVVMDESVVDYQMRTILGANYMRINSELHEINDDMDDCTKNNILNLKALGRHWFETHREDIEGFLS